MKKTDADQHRPNLAEIKRIEHAVDAFQGAQPAQAISAMRVAVSYYARIGRIEHFKREDEHFFRFGEDPLGRIRKSIDFGSEDAKETKLNAHAVRTEFLNVKNWTGAFDFLTATGKFAPLGGTISWGQFQRWQLFARIAIARTHSVSAMVEGDCTAEEQVEALKALSGHYSSFFAAQDERAAILDPDWLELQKRRERHSHLGPSYLAQNIQVEKRSKMWQWFRQPPAKAYSILWGPKRNEDYYAALPMLKTEGTMIDFLLTREALRPVLVITALNTLEAIAAAIFADFCNGIEYRTCEFCKKLIEVGSQKGKRFCNQKKCKNAAHSRKSRKNKRDLMISEEESRNTTRKQ